MKALSLTKASQTFTLGVGPQHVLSIPNQPRIAITSQGALIENSSWTLSGDEVVWSGDELLLTGPSELHPNITVDVQSQLVIFSGPMAQIESLTVAADGQPSKTIDFTLGNMVDALNVTGLTGYVSGFVSEAEAFGTPIASAGANQSIASGQRFVLDGSNTTPLPGVKYLWEQTAGPAVVMSNPGKSAPFVYAPVSDSEQTLEFQLTATSEDGEATTASVSVTVAADTRVDVDIAGSAGQFTDAMARAVSLLVNQQEDMLPANTQDLLNEVRDLLGEVGVSGLSGAVSGVAELRTDLNAGLSAADAKTEALRSKKPAGTEQNVAELILAVMAGRYAVGDLINTIQYLSSSKIGSNTYELMDAGSSSARPPEDKGEVLHVGDDGLWLRGLFLDGYYRLSQFGGNPDGESNNLTPLSNLMVGTRNIIIDKGEFYIDGDGSASPLIEWFGLNTPRFMLGAGSGLSKIICSPNVQNLFAVTGLTIDGIEFDGGFDPSKNKANLKPLLTLNENTVMTNCKIRNTYGSNVFSKFGPVRIENNDLGNYGDHAFYVSADDMLGAETSNIKFINNSVAQDPSYTNDDAAGQREAIKIRNKVTNVKVLNNTLKRVAVGVRFEADTYPPEDVLVSGNHVSCEPSQALVSPTDQNPANYYGVSFASSPINVKIENNTFIGFNDGSGQGVFANAPVSGVEINNNVISKFKNGLQSSGSSNLANSTVYRNIINCSEYGIFQVGAGTKIERNLVSGSSVGGIRDKHGNQILENDIDMGGTGDALVFVVESDINQPKRFVHKNKMRNAARGLYLAGLTNGIGLKITENEFFHCSGSVVSSNSDDALAKSEYWGNQNVEGTGSFQAGIPQGIKSEVYAGLPSASEQYRGKTIIHTVADIDTAYICLRTNATSYAWVQIS